MGQAPDLELLRDFAIALLIGALVGIDREKKKAAEGGLGFGGVRTFILISLTGAVSGYLADAAGAPWFFALTLLAVAGFVVAGYLSHLQHRASDIGLTTEFAALAVFLLGGLSAAGSPQLAVPLGIVVSAALAYKDPLHQFVQKIGQEDFYAALKLLIASFIVLPVLPNRTFDPWDAVNPYKLWLLVILISALSFVGYLASRWLGPRRGLAVTGLTGGLVSSTAVTLSLAKHSREAGTLPTTYDAVLASVMISWVVMVVRIVVIGSLVNLALLPSLLVCLIPMALATLAMAVWFYLKSKRGPDGGKSGGHVVPLKNPFRLTSAMKFALLFLAVLLLVKLVERVARGWGFYVVAGLAGLTDMDAITLSMAEYARQAEAVPTAMRAIIIAALSNTLVKSGMMLGLGARPLRLRVLLATTVIVAAGVAGLFLPFGLTR